MCNLYVIIFHTFKMLYMMCVQNECHVGVSLIENNIDIEFSDQMFIVRNYGHSPRFVHISWGFRFSWTMLSMMPEPLLYRNWEQVSPRPGINWSTAWKLKVVKTCFYYMLEIQILPTSQIWLKKSKMFCSVVSSVMNSS